MKKKILILCMTFLLIISGCGNADSVQNTEQKSSYQQVSMEEGLELMNADSEFILLDVRRTDEFEAGHIPGAINIPNESIGTEEIAQLPDKDQTIYVYCRSGNRSKQASKKLVGLGYTNIVEIGGIIDYPGEITTSGTGLLPQGWGFCHKDGGFGTKSGQKNRPRCNKKASFRTSVPAAVGTGPTQNES